MDSYEQVFVSFESKLLKHCRKNFQLKKLIDEQLEKNDNYVESIEQKKKEIDDKVKKYQEKILQEEDMDCKNDDDEQVIPTIDVLEECLQTNKSTVDEILMKINQNSAEYNEQTEPYLEKLSEFEEFKQKIHILKNDIKLREEWFKNSKIRVTKPSENVYSIVLQRDGGYVYGFRIKDDGSDPTNMWKQIKEKLKIIA